MKLQNRRGLYPTFKGVLLATDSKQRDKFFELAGQQDSFINLPLEGGDTAVFTLGNNEVETSVVAHTLKGDDILKFWTKSGTYYCFSLKMA